MIERLIISHFRGIRKGILKDLGKINLLVGPNNSGKTAILEALYWLSICGRKCRILIDEKNEKKQFPEIGLDAFIPLKKDILGYLPCQRIWKRHGKPVSLKGKGKDITIEKLSYSIPHLTEKDLLKTFRIIAPPDKEIVDTKGFAKGDIENTCFFVLDNPEGVGDMLRYYFPDVYPDAFSFPDGKQRRYAFMWFQDFIYRGERLGAWGTEGRLANADCVLFFDFHTTSGHFTKEFYEEKFRLSEMERRLKKSFNNVFPLGDFDVSIEFYNGEYQGIIKQAGMPPIPIDDFGDGARHAFKVLAALTVLADRCKNTEDTLRSVPCDASCIIPESVEGLFLWEDPELFMHPATIKKLLEEITKIVKDKQIQVFISTQSLEVLAYIAKMLDDKAIEEKDVRTYTLNLVNGELTARKFWGTALSDWLRSGFDPRLLDVSEDDLPFAWHLKKEKTEEELLW